MKWNFWEFLEFFFNRKFEFGHLKNWWMKFRKLTPFFGVLNKIWPLNYFFERRAAWSIPDSAKTFFGQRLFRPKKFFFPKNDFFGQKIFFTKMMFSAKDCFGQKYFCFLQKWFFRPKNIFYQNDFFGQRFFRPKNIFL